MTSAKITFTTDREILALKEDEVRTYLVKDKLSMGLFIEVKPSGVRSWHYRYTLNGKQERLVLGKYPDLPLKEARRLRDEAATMVALGESPSKMKADIKKGRNGGVSVLSFGGKYFNEVISKERKDPTTMLRILVNDIYPAIGSKAMEQVTTGDVRDIIWKKKDQGYDAAASEVRGLLKRMFDYATTLGVIKFNPVLAIPTRHVFKPKGRDRYLSNDEIKRYYTAMLDSRIYRARKLGLLLPLLTLVRKSELNHAKWEHVNLETGIWLIPIENSKTKKQMNVYLSKQVIEIFRELKVLSAGSSWVFPARGGYDAPIGHNTLNNALKVSLRVSDVPDFTIHDLRRTASTHLNEMGFNSDHIEACMNHADGSVRGIYNKAAYEPFRKTMMQQWADRIYTLIFETNIVFFNRQVNQNLL